MKPKIRTVLFAFIVLAATVASVGLFLFNKQHADLSKIRPDFVIEADNLINEFTTNEAAATRKYLNKVIEVTGITDYIKQGEGNITSVALRSKSGITTIICTFPPGADLSGLNENAPVTIKGECSGFLMDILLNNCVLSGQSH